MVSALSIGLIIIRMIISKMKITFFMLCLVLLFVPLNCEDVKRSYFPENFLFGAGTSAYQVEGAYLKDGKGLNNWDVFTRIEGKIKNGDTGDNALDHYNRFLEDVELMHSMGLTSYRFSISWARILPRGKVGQVNEAGLLFYDILINALLLKGITPFVTLNHHDHPEELEERFGGWLGFEMQDEFEYYAEICFQRYSDRVKLWATINEPNMFAEMAYVRGTYPPAHYSKPFSNHKVGNSDREPLIAMHNMLLAHAKAARLHRNVYNGKHGWHGKLGIVLHAFWYKPYDENNIHDRDAAKRALAFTTGWVLDPLGTFIDDYPPEMRKYLGDLLPKFKSPYETDLVRSSIDFIGINHYGTLYAKDCIYSSCDCSGPACGIGGDHPIHGYLITLGDKNGTFIGEQTGMPRFFSVPEGMEEIVNHMKNRYYNIPMYITENGYASLNSDASPAELQNDVERVKYHKSYLAYLARAMRNGANVRGYFIWTLMDNFEWTSGYDLKFGLVHVDRESVDGHPPTYKRVPKLSAKWYRDFLANRSPGTGHETWEAISLKYTQATYQTNNETASI